MPEAKFSGYVEPTQVQPGAAREMSVPASVSHSELAAKAREMSGGVSTERAATQPGIPVASEGVNAPLPSALVMATPAPSPMMASGAAPSPARMETAAEAAKGAQGPHGPGVGYQGTGDRR